MWWLIDYYTIHVAFAFRFGQRFHREPYMSESSDPHGYVVTTPINCIDRWFCTANDIFIGTRFHSCLEGRSRISAETRPYATSLAFSPPCISHSVFGRKHIEWSHRVFIWKSEAISAWIASFDEFSPSKCVHTLPWPWSLDLNHCEGCLQSNKRCLSTVVGFGYVILQNRYSWSKYHAPMMTLRDFPIRVSLGVPMSQPVCASWSWGCGGFPSTGCILPIRCSSTQGRLAFTDLEDSSISFVALQKARSWSEAVLLPLFLWNRELSGFYWYLHSFGRISNRIERFCNTFEISKWIWQVICMCCKFVNPNVESRFLSTWLWGGTWSPN
jgi:hypothetical protein